MNGFRGPVASRPTEPLPNQHAALIAVEGVTKVYRAAGSSRISTPAVSNATFDVRHGECLGIVGESGSGKTTLGSCMAGLLQPSAGRIRFVGKVVNEPGRPPCVPRLRGVQVVFQDPVSSLNPRRAVGSVLAEILSVHRLAPRSGIKAAVSALLQQVGLSPDLADRRPGRLSGGQQQRVAIARALSFDPRLIVADEIVSSLDASVQAQILNLLDELRRLRNLSIVLITHDLAVARQLCDRLAVMQRGEIVELGATDSILRSPGHDYTRQLLAAAPRLAVPRGAGGG
jgi:ABC-type glutathione transport system ATPase component